MYLYLYINLAILFLPLAISFERKRINYQSRIKSVVLSIISVGTVFVAWDVLATYRGHWSFNPDYVVGARLLGLPIEEILFFVTVPFSCLFTYEALMYFLKDGKIHLAGKLQPVVGIVFVFLSFFFLNKEYTFLALLSVGMTILIAPKVVGHIFSSKLYWYYIAATFAFFLVFNFFLTSLPIVEYSNQAISGLRVTTIPIEDLMFNFSLLTLYLAVYLRLSRNRKRTG